MYGPDATFLGVPAADLEVRDGWSAARAVVLGAPFDGGTSYRPGCRFGPYAIRTTDYLPHDGARPHLALGVEPLGDNDFYGQSYFIDPRGQLVGAAGVDDADEVIVRDLDMDKLTEVRDLWQFYRDRRPDSYESLVKP